MNIAMDMGICVWIWVYIGYGYDDYEVGKVNRVMCCSDHLSSPGPPYLIHLLPRPPCYDENDADTFNI